MSAILLAQSNAARIRLTPGLSSVTTLVDVGAGVSAPRAARAQARALQLTPSTNWISGIPQSRSEVPVTSDVASVPLKSVPVLRWLPEYRAEWLRPDLVAG